jgi:transmembrane sensor
VTQNNPSDSEPAGVHSPTDDPLVVEALDWFVRLQAGEGDAGIVREFRAWVEGDARRAAAFEKVAATWGAPELLLATRNVAKATGFSTPRPRSRRRSLAKKVAATTTAVILAFGLAHLSDLTVRFRADYVTAAGEQRAVVLPDGSKMTLNTETAVALDFSRGRRGVNILQGEAYFDVLPGQNLTFEVVGQFGQVEVKGTAFSVRLDDNEDNVVLSRGSVDVARRAQSRDHTVLAPGEMVSVTAASVLPVTRVDTGRSLAWLEGRISFYDQPLGRVLKDIRRYYPGRIFVFGNRIEQTAVSGNYKLDQPALIIRSLAEAAGATMTTLPGGVIILR